MTIWFLIVKHLILAASRMAEKEPSYEERREARFQMLRNLLIAGGSLVLIFLGLLWWATSQPASRGERSTDFSRSSLPVQDYSSQVDDGRPSQQTQLPEVVKPEQASVLNGDTKQAGHSSTVEVVPADAQQTLAAWASAMQQNDPALIGRYYAPVVRRYFLQTEVTSGDVIKDKASFLAKGGRINKFTISDVVVIHQAFDLLSLKLVKNIGSSLYGQERDPVLIHSVLTLKSEDDGWKIVMERDLSSSHSPL